MFDELLRQLGNAASPFSGFLGDLWTVWSRDAARAVLKARWSWKKLPEELVQQAALIQRQVQAAQTRGEIDEQVNRQLGTMGIFPGLAGSSSAGFGMDPDRAMFILFMGMIRAHEGNPPTSQGMAQLSEDVLRGRLDPVEAIAATAPPLVQQQLAIAVQMLQLIGMYRVLQLQAVVQAAFSLPRERIPVLLPEVRDI